MVDQFKFLDLSGFQFTGKAAVHDLISEFDGFFTPGQRVEFDLIRVKDGLSDLEDALINWSPIRSDAAIRRFLRVVARMSNGASGISRFFDPGFGYSKRYPNFVKRTQEFIDSLTKEKWEVYWPYHLIEMSRFQVFRFKILRKIFGDTTNMTYYLASEENFYKEIKSYLYDLLTNGVNSKKYHTIIMNNAFEGFNPAKYHKYFNHVKSIIVDRDPRDVFVIMNGYSLWSNDHYNSKRRRARQFDVKMFINRCNIYRAHRSQTLSDNILSLNFEDLIADYEQTVESIYHFLNISPNEHNQKMKYFNPNTSVSNVGVWKTYPDQQSIRMIEDALFD